MTIKRISLEQAEAIARKRLRINGGRWLTYRQAGDLADDYFYHCIWENRPLIGPMEREHPLRATEADFIQFCLARGAEEPQP